MMKKLLSRFVWAWFAMSVFLLGGLTAIFWPDRRLLIFSAQQRLGWSAPKNATSIVERSKDEGKEQLIPLDSQIDDKQAFDLAKPVDQKRLLALVLKLVFQPSRYQPQSMQIAWKTREMNLDEIDFYLIRNWGEDGAPPGEPTNSRLILRNLPGEMERAPSMQVVIR